VGEDMVWGIDLRFAQLGARLVSS